jgi:hypothetical protein
VAVQTIRGSSELRTRGKKIAVVATAVAAIAVGGAIAAETSTGPSSSESPYVVPTASGVQLKSILTVGDAAGNGYRMAGIPDGLGAFDNGGGTFTVLMNHEIGTGLGAVRAHGANGSFISKWTIKKGSYEVLSGEDLIQQVATWNGTSYNPSAKGVAFNRFCSADLPAQSALYDAATDTGYKGRLFLNGEESGREGRAWAHGLDGTSWELPYLGNASWENVLANPGTGRQTVVVGMNDSTGDQIYVYIGTKQKTGNPVEQAGLSGGRLFAVKVDGYPVEPAAGIPAGTSFHLVEIQQPQVKTGAQIRTEAKAQGATDFNRPEDGSWDAKNVTDFYWVTTASFGGTSRLWRLNFDPATFSDPSAGGTIDMLLDGTEGQQMMDNITVDDGHVKIQEDVGNNPRLGKVWDYAIATDTLTELAQHDPERFLVPGSKFKTMDEESSGIIPVDFLGDNAYLLDVQAHYPNADPTLVEGGQLLLLHAARGAGNGNN